MDLKNSVKILCAPARGLNRGLVHVQWSKEYFMKPHSSLHTSFENAWLEKSKQCTNLFNASKFRLHGIEFLGFNKGVCSTATLFLGTTSYKEFIGTNFAPCASQLMADGLTDFSDSQAYLADPLGVGALIETIDKNLIFMRRSGNLAEMQGLVDRPGGHPEPNEVEKATGHSLSTEDNSEIADEIFESVLKEIRDEINIPLENLSAPLLLGISYNPHTWNRPSAEFYVKCPLTAKEVQDLYTQQTQAECEESTELVVIPVSKVLKLEEFQKSHLFNELTPACQSALFLLNIYHS